MRLWRGCVRVVLDTNIVVSALISRGSPPDQLYRAWIDNRFTLVSSADQIQELLRVLRYDRIRSRIHPDDEREVLVHFSTLADLAEDLPHVELSRDPDDNRILATAIAGNADLIVSGDRRDMLSLSQVERIAILTARDAVERFNF